MNFFFEKIPSIFDIENWLWKYDFGTFWRTVSHRRICLKKFPLSILILGQKSRILGPTVFKCPQPNWHCIAVLHAYMFLKFLPNNTHLFGPKQLLKFRYFFYLHAYWGPKFTFFPIFYSFCSLFSLQWLK